jgi:hypothetical protein
MAASMKKLLADGRGGRLASVSIGLLVANFVLSILVDQLGFQIHPNTAATGALLLAAIINYVVSKYFRRS